MVATTEHELFTNFRKLSDIHIFNNFARTTMLVPTKFLTENIVDGKKNSTISSNACINNRI